METKQRSIDIEKVVKSMDNGSMSFELLIQRVADQWNSEQKSLLIDTVMRGYKIPAVWITRTTTEQFVKNSIIDGKQRLTTLYQYVNNEFRLHKNIEPVTFTTEDSDEIEEDIIVEVAGKKFSQLPEFVQSIILNYDIDMMQMFNYTDEQIEEQFYRLNNGAVFTKSQKANVVLGSDLAGKIKEVEEMSFWERANFSKNQRKHGEITSCILQTLMLLTGYEFNNFGANEVLKFAEYYAENYNEKDIEYLKELIQKLDESLEDNEENNKFLKKINIPALIMNVDKEMSLDYEITTEQYTEFLNQWIGTDAETSGYLENCGQGSTNVLKVTNRSKIMDEWLQSFSDNLMLEGGGNENEEIGIGA